MTQRRNRVNRQPFSGHSERWHHERRPGCGAYRDPVMDAMYADPSGRPCAPGVLLDANYICASPTAAAVPRWLTT